MSDLIVLNIICFQTQKQLATLSNIRVQLKSVLIDVSGHNFMHAKTLLRGRCMHGRHRAGSLSSPATSSFSHRIQYLFFLMFASLLLFKSLVVTTVEVYKFNVLVNRNKEKALKWSYIVIASN